MSFSFRISHLRFTLLKLEYFHVALTIDVATIFNWGGGGGAKFKKSYPTAGTNPENFSGGMQILIRLSVN